MLELVAFICFLVENFIYQKHEEKSFRNLIKSNRNQIVSQFGSVWFEIRLIWNHTDVHLVHKTTEDFEKISLRIGLLFENFIYPIGIQIITLRTTPLLPLQYQGEEGLSLISGLGK